jgi:DNA-binding FrmR family transcriptional regulator
MISAKARFPSSPIPTCRNSRSHEPHNRDKQKLLLRAKRIQGQVEALVRALTEEHDCSDVLQLIKATTRTAARSTLSSFVLAAGVRRGWVFSSIHATHDSRSTEGRKIAHNIPSDNPSRLTVRSQRNGRQQAFRKAGFDCAIPELTHSLPPIPAKASSNPISQASEKWASRSKTDVRFYFAVVVD